MPFEAPYNALHGLINNCNLSHNTYITYTFIVTPLKSAID